LNLTTEEKVATVVVVLVVLIVTNRLSVGVVPPIKAPAIVRTCPAP
jgi:hypothetical protein